MSTVENEKINNISLITNRIKSIIKIMEDMVSNEGQEINISGNIKAKESKLLVGKYTINMKLISDNKQSEEVIEKLNNPNINQQEIIDVEGDT